MTERAPGRSRTLALPHAQGDQYWYGDDDRARAATRVFEGRHGLGRLSDQAFVSAPEPELFRARLTRVKLDHMALGAFAASPHTRIRTRRHIDRQTAPWLTFLLLAEGDLRIDLATASFDLGRGEYVLLDSRDTVSYASSASSRMLLSTAGIEHLPPYLRQRSATVPGPQPRTPLSDTFGAIISSVLQSSTSDRPAFGSHLARAVTDMHSAVLAESLSTTDWTSGSIGLRYRIEEYIELHLTDPQLDPASVAAAHGISLRHVHNVFDEGDRTLGRFIRDRRIAAVARVLRTTSGTGARPDLATEYGFSSTAAMSRAFKTRLGVSLQDYRAGDDSAHG